MVQTSTTCRRTEPNRYTAIESCCTEAGVICNDGFELGFGLGMGTNQ